MKKIIALAVFTVITISGSISAYAAPQSFTGLVSDSMCKRKHMMPGKSDATCVNECVKAGSSYVLLVGDKAYMLSARQGVLAGFAGKQVKVTGELKNNTLTVASIQ